MAPPPFGYYPKPPSWTAAIFEKHVGKMPSATGYSTAQIHSVFFRLQMGILKFINACHAYLTLSTHDPTSLMKPELARAFELGRFSASTPIARIVSLADGSSSATLNGVGIAVTQFYGWEVVLSKATAY
ncbi:hypothetical protein KCU61_g4615, partial [Aureobasidium melanogenum]